ncbi:MAG TPA: hypothetical protein VFJ47_13170 [Terriglobales bacterium]|nr:hypothetical protein [Terriglobales bacterium]
MSTLADNIRTAETAQALAQLLKTRSYEEIRQRMYDNPPGSPWWSACKTELDLRNGENISTAVIDASRVLDKMRICSEHLDGSTDKLLQASTEISEALKGARELGRKIEIAVYVMLGVSILQLFHIAFLVMGKR